MFVYICYSVNLFCLRSLQFVLQKNQKKKNIPYFFAGQVVLRAKLAYSMMMLVAYPMCNQLRFQPRSWNFTGKVHIFWSLWNWMKVFVLTSPDLRTQYFLSQINVRGYNFCVINFYNFKPRILKYNRKIPRMMTLCTCFYGIASGIIFLFFYLIWKLSHFSVYTVFPIFVMIDILLLSIRLPHACFSTKPFYLLLLKCPLNV